MHLTLAGGEERSQTEHKHLLKLCQNGQIEQACDYLKQHILTAKTEILQLIES
jgi:DNA-binding GntR family transcriptional regulator